MAPNSFLNPDSVGEPIYLTLLRKGNFLKLSLYFPESAADILKSLVRGRGEEFFHIAERPSRDTHVIHVDPREIARVGVGREVLLQVEPEVVRPDLYTKGTLDMFDLIVPISRERAERQGLEFWVDLPIEIPAYKKQNKAPDHFVALVNEHKFSAISRSKYGLRREVIRMCNSSGIELHLFGKQWDENKYIELQRRLYSLRIAASAHSRISITECFSDLFYRFKSLGVMDPLGQGLQKFKCSIVIENDTDYVSEKVWKSLYAGAIPVYVGPSLEKFGALNDLVIRAEDQARNIVESLERVRQIEIQPWRARVDGYLNSKDFRKKCSPLLFWKRLHEILVQTSS